MSLAASTKVALSIAKCLYKKEAPLLAAKNSKIKKPGQFMRAMFAEALEMPEELALDLPRVTLIGNVSLHIENHRGIINYSAQEVRLRVSEGYLIARGSGFKLRSISKTDVSLEGEINNLAIVLDADAPPDGPGGWLNSEDLAQLLREELADMPEAASQTAENTSQAGQTED
jgi:sporulation protein YqfC